MIPKVLWAPTVKCMDYFTTKILIAAAAVCCGVFSYNLETIEFLK